MPPFRNMSTELRTEYMDQVGKLIAPIVPDDGRFIVIMIDSGGNGMNVANVDPEKIPDVLRVVADQIENNQKKGK